MFSQVGFLDTKILGFDSWIAFKKYYAEWEEKTVWVKGKERKFHVLTLEGPEARPRRCGADAAGRAAHATSRRGALTRTSARVRAEHAARGAHARLPRRGAAVRPPRA